MFNKILLPLLILFLLPVLVNAQEVKPPPNESKEQVYYLHNGKFTPKEVVEKYKKPKHNDNLNRSRFGDVYLSPDDLEDTLGFKGLYPPNYAGYSFGMFGQDRMIQWVEAPADMRIVSVGMMCVDKDDTTNGSASIKLVEFAWTMDQIENVVTPQYMGYYEATGSGYNDATAFLDDPDRTGGWVDSSGLGLTSPFGNDIWSDGGVGFPFIPFLDLDWNDGGCRTPDCMDEYNWVNMDILFEPEVERFDIIGMATKNLDPVMVTLGVPEPPNRIGWYAAGDVLLPLQPPPTFKFYQGGRLSPPNDFGWWAREWTFDYVLAVVLTGDTPPDINSWTQLTSTISHDPRTIDANITDENPAGGDVGVDVAKIVYSTDGGVNWEEVEMTGTEPDYTGDIPGMPGGTEVTYKVEATDVGGNTSTTMPVVYGVFGVVNGTNLVILNGFDGPDGFPQNYYFGEAVQSGTTTFPYDVWMATIL